MNVYDFDDTIYQGDSTFDFIKECLKYPKLLISIVLRSWMVIPFGLKIWDKTTFKSNFFGFIKHIEDMDAFLDDFTQSHLKNIKQWYLDQHKDDDVIISASPYFLIEGFCKAINIKYIYGTDMDKSSGKIKGINCKGEAKVTLFKLEFKQSSIDAFYSDSKTDSPLARLANKAYLVKDNDIQEWPKEWL